MHEPLSFWQSTLATSLANEDLPASATVAVIGGGLHGVCAAYWLARQGVRPVLVERNALAAGATGRNGGHIVVGTAEDYPHAITRLGHPAARAIWQLTLDNHTLLLNVLREEGLDVGYRETGHLKLALDEEQHLTHQHAVAMLHADGFEAMLLDRAQTQELIDTPLGETIAGALFLPHSGTVHSARLVHELARAAQRHGARIVGETTVQSIAASSGGLRIATTRGELHTERAIIALNAWSGDLVPGLAERVTPVRGQALAYASIAPIFRTGCSAAITPTGEYWHQTGDGTIVVGGCRVAAPGSDVGVRTQTPSDEVQAAIERVLPALFPQLPPLVVAHRWAGLMAFTRDYNPVVDRAPALPGAWVVGGFSGHGMPFGLRFGQLVAQAALGHETPPELAPFRLNRPSLRD